MIILEYNNQIGQYLVDRIFQNNNESWGYRLYPEPQWWTRNFTEEHNPYLIVHINLSDLETRYPSKDFFENGSRNTGMS